MKMLDKMDKELDAIVVAAPDHIHAPASIRAMKAGKHVYCEKPLTNTVNESRRMRAVARETKVATQMGNEQFKGFAGPPRTLPRSPGHEKEWANACKGGPMAMSNFNHSGPLAECCLLGNVATQFAEGLEFDPQACKIVNHERAHAALHREHRQGWEI